MIDTTSTAPESSPFSAENYLYFRRNITTLIMMMHRRKFGRTLHTEAVALNNIMQSVILKFHTENPSLLPSLQPNDWEAKEGGGFRHIDGKYPDTP